MSIPLVAAAVVATLVMFDAAGAQQTTEGPPPATAARTGNADNGKKLFVKYGCYECHGREGQGGVAFGPRLAPNPMAYAAFVRYVRAPRGDMPPYSDKLTRTFEDEGIRDDESRLQAFGQEDHVRLYGKDLFSRLQDAGFVSKVLDHDAVLKDYDESLYGVNRREPFMCVERPAVV